MSNDEPKKTLRPLPSVDALLRTVTARALLETVGTAHLTQLARAVTDEMRASLLAQLSSDQSGNGDHSREGLLAEAERMLDLAGRKEATRGLRHVINATGVIIHTNLGRAPLSDAARRAVASEASRYCTLEFDLDTGARGQRGAGVEYLLAELTGAEDALIVNNCAAAALLVLSVLARDGEAILSRGEMVEIGGDFRVPDVMAQSGTRLVEVGTTNRTRLDDYLRAITPDTRMIMRVHPSNYRIVGFTTAPTLAALCELAHESNIPLYEDAGSGALVDFGRFDLNGEPVISESIKAGADLVTFSGDKLLGAAQAGLIVGRRHLVEQLRTHPLYRALRADKLALAALESTLLDVRREAFDEIPAVRMLAMTSESIKKRAEALVTRLGEHSTTSSLRFEIVEGNSAAGGGSAPTTHPLTALIALSHETLAADDLANVLRHAEPPIISRIGDSKVLLDLRTVFEDEEEALFSALRTLPA